MDGRIGLELDRHRLYLPKKFPLLLDAGPPRVYNDYSHGISIRRNMAQKDFGD